MVHERKEVAMGVEKVLFKSEEKRGRQEIAELLRQIAAKVEAGRLTLSQGATSLDIDFPSSMTVEIKVEEEEKAVVKRSLEIELEWRLGQDDDQGEVRIG